MVEVRRADGSGPQTDVSPGEVIELSGEQQVRVDAAFPDEGEAGARLWRVTPVPGRDRTGYLLEHGRPIRYGYLSGSRPIDDLQNVYGLQPGSAEMASAGRPFTAELLVRLMARGVTVAPIVLQAASPAPRRTSHPCPSGSRCLWTRPGWSTECGLGGQAGGGGRHDRGAGTREGGRRGRGTVRPRAGWTDLVLGPDRPAQVVSGLISGLHPPEASHLLLLEAVAGPALVQQAYAAAVAEGYLWHEFGDSMLFLP